VASARHIVVGMDIWTKKSLSASYLGISGCFYSPETNCAIHVLLNLQIGHSHFGDIIAEKFEATLQERRISYEQVLLVISDNGSNMTKAVKVLDHKVGIEKELVRLKTATLQNIEDDENTSECSEFESGNSDSNGDGDDSGSESSASDGDSSISDNDSDNETIIDHDA
jgi:hypothetical protein